MEEMAIKTRGCYISGKFEVKTAIDRLCLENCQLRSLMYGKRV